MQTNSVSRDVIAHHEARHAVAGLVLGVPFTEVRIVPGEDGKIGVPLKTNPWTGPRPASNPGEFTDEEWAELSLSYNEWEAWKKRDNDSYAILYCVHEIVHTLGERSRKVERKRGLREHQILPSMSRPANPYNNATCESFIKILK